MAEHNLRVPAKPGQVRSFLNEKRDRFVSALQSVMECVERARVTDLDCIYKIYSRSEKQADELKHSRKVRIKFNEFNSKNIGGYASVYDVPDIVGFTVVVKFPSDINDVARFVDDYVERNIWKVPYPVPDEGEAVGGLFSKYGRIIEKDGYQACHYNVQTNEMAGKRPIVEIQIKTLLHDAWGAKTHDLSYKPSVKTDAELLVSLDLLGDMLVKIDQQSDSIRRMIERGARVRAAKRSEVQKEILLMGILGSLPKGRFEARLSALRDHIYQARSELDKLQPKQTLDALFELFDEAHAERDIRSCYFVCRLFCALSALTGRRGHFASAMEVIEAWDDICQDLADKIWAKTIGALACFGAGDVSEAIDRAETAASLLEDAEIKDDASISRVRRLGLSLYSSLAYYHADQIGSHEGEKRKSAEEAKRCLALAQHYWESFGLPKYTISSNIKQLEELLSDEINVDRIFNFLDNEAFVKIQTTTELDEAEDLQEKLSFIHGAYAKVRPSHSACLLEFHDYCARAKIAELESNGYDDP